MVTGNGEIIQNIGPGQSRIMYVSGDAVKADFINGSGGKETVDLSAGRHISANNSVTNLSTGITDIRLGGSYVGRYDGNKQSFQRFDESYGRGATSPISTSTLNSSYNAQDNVLAATSKNGDGKIFINAVSKMKPGTQAGSSGKPKPDEKRTPQRKK
jgi:hypothetical protein